MKSRIISYFSIFLIFLILSSFMLPFSAEEAFEAMSEQALIINADTGSVLYKKNETQQVYCGFLPRVMTCILLLEHTSNLNEQVTVTNSVLKNTPQISSANLKTGDTISLYDLISCILIGNSQEAAVTAAFYISSTLSDFVALMNKKAKDLGALNTVFTNIHGYYTNNTIQTTTVLDISKILIYAVNFDPFLEICNKKYTNIIINEKVKPLYTRNSLIDSGSPYYFKKAEGLVIYGDTRIGSGMASMCVDKSMRMIAIAVTKDGVSDLYEDMKELLSFALEEYSYKTLIKNNTPVYEIKVSVGKESDHLVLVSQDELEAPLPRNVDIASVKKLIQAPSEVKAPINKGDIIGTLTLEYEGVIYGTTNLLAQTSISLDITEIYSQRINQIFGNKYLWLILILILLLLFFYIFLTYLKNRRKIRKFTNKKPSGSRMKF